MAFNFAHDVALPTSAGEPVGFLIYPQAETTDGRLDSLDPDSFNVNNFAGTNVGYYLPPDTSKVIMALATAIDPITIWILALCSICVSIVAGTKRSAGYIAVFGWWILLVLIGVGAAAAFS